MRRTPVLAKWNDLSEVQAELLSPTLALQITDYSYFETHMLPLSVRHKKIFIIYFNI
jgi:hypothetical protein